MYSDPRLSRGWEVVRPQISRFQGPFLHAMLEIFTTANRGGPVTSAPDGSSQRPSRRAGGSRPLHTP